MGKKQPSSWLIGHAEALTKLLDEGKPVFIIDTDCSLDDLNEKVEKLWDGRIIEWNNPQATLEKNLEHC